MKNVNRWYLKPIDTWTADVNYEHKKSIGRNDQDYHVKNIKGKAENVCECDMEFIARLIMSTRQKGLKFEIYRSENGMDLILFKPIPRAGEVKFVFTAHELRGDIENNKKSIEEICEKKSTSRVILLAPYLQTLRFARSADEKDQVFGLSLMIELFARGTFNEMWLYGKVISPGMENHIFAALRFGIKIVPKTPETEEAYQLLIGS